MVGLGDRGPSQLLERYCNERRKHHNTMLRMPTPFLLGQMLHIIHSLLA